MKCVYCTAGDSRVVDSRQSEDGNVIRRRRECLKCGKRFTTYEKADPIQLTVIKKNGQKQSFDLSKLKRGIERACEKRPVSDEKIEELVDEIQLHCISSNSTEIESSILGRMVMEKLKYLDEIAYARFSCVYHEFKDLQTFVSDLEKLIQENRGKAD